MKQGGDTRRGTRTRRPSLKDSVKNPHFDLVCPPSSPHNSVTQLVHELHTCRTGGDTRRGTMTSRPSFKGNLKSCSPSGP